MKPTLAVGTWLLLAFSSASAQAPKLEILWRTEAQQPVANPLCEKCGAEMRYKGFKMRAVESRAGEIAIERGYYYCTCCRSGFFPPGQAT